MPTAAGGVCGKAPKVILVGEMRDRLTRSEIALMASGNGHLFEHAPTVDARPVDQSYFRYVTLGEEQQQRVRLYDVLRDVVSPRLAPKNVAVVVIVLMESWGTI